MITKGISVGKAMRVMEITLVCSLLVVAVSLGWTVVHMRHVSDHLEREHRAICERINMQARYLNQLNASADAGLRPVAVPDCRHIVN